MITAMDNFCQNNFVNSTYASSARSMRGSSTADDTLYDGDLTGMSSTNTLCNIHATYWLATPLTINDYKNEYNLRMYHEMRSRELSL